MDSSHLYPMLMPWLVAIAVVSSANISKASDAFDAAKNFGQEVHAQVEQERVRMKDTLSEMEAVQAQAFEVSGQTDNQARLSELPAGTGVLRMQELMKAIQSEKYDALDEQTRLAIETAKTSAAHATNPANMDAQTVFNTIGQSESWQKQMIDAYVAALPPRDQALGRSVLSGDGTIPDYEGKLYIFVSRSMPVSLLKAYAMDALYTGAALVVKGIRKGDTVKDYVIEMLEDYNSVDGQILAGMEINPNLFDMFGVEVVPTVVWSNRGGLDDIGSGCVSPPEFATITTTVQGPDFTDMVVEKPTCLPVDESSYYKLAGALKMEYVLERFSNAGAPAFAMGAFSDRLAERHSNVHQAGQRPTLGNAMPPMIEDLSLDRMPRHVLESWRDGLGQFNVRRGPYGPAFGDEEEDDPVFRQELMEKVRHGLGL